MKIKASATQINTVVAPSERDRQWKYSARIYKGVFSLLEKKGSPYEDLKLQVNELIPLWDLLCEVSTPSIRGFLHEA